MDHEVNRVLLAEGHAAVLGVTTLADERALRVAFYRVSKLVHPDKNPTGGHRPAPAERRAGGRAQGGERKGKGGGIRRCATGVPEGAERLRVSRSRGTVREDAERGGAGVPDTGRSAPSPWMGGRGNFGYTVEAQLGELGFSLATKPDWLMVEHIWSRKHAAQQDWADNKMGEAPYQLRRLGYSLATKPDRLVVEKGFWWGDQLKCTLCDAVATRGHMESQRHLSWVQWIQPTGQEPLEPPAGRLALDVADPVVQSAQPKAQPKAKAKAKAKANSKAKAKAVASRRTGRSR